MTATLRSIFRSILGVASTAAANAPVPGATIVVGPLETLIKKCDEVAKNKTDVAELTATLRQYDNILRDTGSIADAEAQEAVDQLDLQFSGMIEKLDGYASKSPWRRMYLQSKISEDLVSWNNELQRGLMAFQVKLQIGVHQRLDHQDQARARDQAELMEHLKQLTTKKNEDGASQIDATSAAAVMEQGQRYLAEQRQTGGGLNNPQYEELTQGLFDLNRLGVPPTVKYLDGEVTRDTTLATYGGTYTEIWTGKWLGKQKVALKALRMIPLEKRRKMRFEREIAVWSDLRHPNIALFYGIVRDIGSNTHIVSKWEDNGNVLKYLEANPTADRLKLMIGAAKGLAYLHQCNVVHGNVRCSNILVSDKGTAVVSDFGMAKVIEEATETAASVTLAQGGSARWLAPELLDTNTTMTLALTTDVYAFGMTMLECITGKPPYANIKHDLAVIPVISKGELPARPAEEDNGAIMLSDAWWDVIQACWAKKEERTTMDVVSSRLQRC